MKYIDRDPYLHLHLSSVHLSHLNSGKSNFKKCSCDKASDLNFVNCKYAIKQHYWCPMVQLNGVSLHNYMVKGNKCYNFQK